MVVVVAVVVVVVVAVQAFLPSHPGRSSQLREGERRRREEGQSLASTAGLHSTVEAEIEAAVVTAECYEWEESAQLMAGWVGFAGGGRGLMEAGLPWEVAVEEHPSLAASSPRRRDFPSAELQRWAGHSAAVVTAAAAGGSQVLKWAEFAAVEGRKPESRQKQSLVENHVETYRLRKSETKIKGFGRQHQKKPFLLWPCMCHTCA